MLDEEMQEATNKFNDKPHFNKQVEKEVDNK